MQKPPEKAIRKGLERIATEDPRGLHRTEARRALRAASDPAYRAEVRARRQAAVDAYAKRMGV